MKEKSVTLRVLCEEFLEIQDAVKDLIQPFCIPLFFPNQGDERKPNFGGGVCVNFCGKKGVLTNHHVAEIFMKEQPLHIYSPHPKTFKPISLKFKQVIMLPRSSDGSGVDIAFIELDSEGNINELGKDWWNLDTSAQKYGNDPSRYWAKENISSWLWVFRATPGEGSVLIEGTIPPDKEVFFPNAGFHWAGPTEPSLFPCCLFDLTKDIDKFDLSISRDGVDGHSLPKSYAGTSGNGLWQIELIDTSKGLKIQEIQLAGLVTEEIYCSSPLVTSLICRGHVSLYETFVPFCTAILDGQSIENSLKKAGFRR